MNRKQRRATHSATGDSTDPFAVALEHYRAGRLDKAAQGFQATLARTPSHAMANALLGAVMKRQGRLAEAEDACRAAVLAQPSFAEAWSELGNILLARGRPDEAIDCQRTALSLKPGFAAATGNLAVALATAQRFEEAEREFRRVVALMPRDPQAHCNLGGVLEELGRHKEAESACRAALALAPTYSEAWSNLGNALTPQGRFDEALASFDKALACRPGFAEVYCNRGRTLKAMGRAAEAIEACREAVRLKPDFAEAHNNLAFSLLLGGEMAEGWREYEWRWQIRRGGTVRPTVPGTWWEGQSLEGRTLLLHPEQGFGDQIQFCRYAALAARTGARVVLRASPLLVRLLSTLPGIERVIATDAPLPAFDAQQTLMSLPRVMGTTLQSIPAEVPYLRADPAATRGWASRLAVEPGLKIGLVWAGDARLYDLRAHDIDRRRSVDLPQLTPLLAIPGTRFVSLQMGPRARQIDLVTPKPLDVMAEVRDFADTAAIIANLDLVITVDTSVAHLAGALGKPVWVLSRYDGCWRWLLDRNDSPWYPTMRLFRQRVPGGWDEVVAETATALADWVGAR